MTEREWLASRDPRELLAFATDHPKVLRKSRLFAVACCRRIEHVIEKLPPGWARLVSFRINTLERSADSLASHAMEPGELLGYVEPLGEVVSPAIRWASEIEHLLS